VPSDDLRAVAQRVADDLPAGIVEEVVLTGSVSRGVADELSDIEMLVVTREPLTLEEAYAASALPEPQSWGPQGTPAHRVFGYREGVPVEQIWWSRAFAEEQIAAYVSAEAIANGVPLRTSGLLAAWQDRLRAYPPELAAARIEDAALRWGGFAPAGVLPIARPGDRLALTEWLVDAATRVLTIVFALNGVWQPTSKRLAARVAPLARKPDRLAERIEEALTEPDPRRALRVMTDLQLDTVLLAPSGPHVDRARAWLSEAAEILRSS
jgi:hypothetical protein